MIVQMVKFKSGLPDSDIEKVIHERAPQFRVLPGLVQKYYVRDRETGEVSGIYLWDSLESLQEFRQSELARTIPEAYRVEGQPRVETYDLLVTLRPEREPAAPR